MSTNLKLPLKTNKQTNKEQQQPGVGAYYNFFPIKPKTYPRIQVVKNVQYYALILF